MALITAAEARDYIPGLTGTTMDTLLDTLIARVGAAFASACGFPPATVGVGVSMESLSTYVLRMTGRGGRDLVLPVWPTTAVASVYDDELLDHGAASLVASSDYNLVQDGRTSLIRLLSTSTHGAWTNGIAGAIKVSCTAGFVTVPAALKDLAGQAVADAYRRRSGAVTVQSSSGSRGAGVSWRDPEQIPLPIRRALVAEFGLADTLVVGL